MNCKACCKKINRKRWKKNHLCPKCGYEVFSPEFNFNLKNYKNDPHYWIYGFRTKSYIVYVALLKNKRNQSISYIHSKKSNQRLLFYRKYFVMDTKFLLKELNKRISPSSREEDIVKYFII